MKLAYFIQGMDALERSDKFKAKTKRIVLLVIGSGLSIITLVFIALAYSLAKERAHKITNGIIRLYTTLDGIRQKQRSDKEKLTPTVLSFKHQCHELNELHKTFNQAAKKVMVAN